MVMNWTKQFLLASGFFAIVIASQATHMAMKQKQLANKHLEDAQRTVRVIASPNYQIN